MSQRIFRDRCYLTQEGYYVKDLRIISDREIKDIVIVDNLAYSFAFQVLNMERVLIEGGEWGAHIVLL